MRGRVFLRNSGSAAAWLCSARFINETCQPFLKWTSPSNVSIKFGTMILLRKPNWNVHSCNIFFYTFCFSFGRSRLSIFSISILSFTTVFLHYIACHFKLINLPSWRVYQGQNCKSGRVFFFSKYTRIFTIQECKYCQLRFSCAIRNETVAIRFSEKSPRCSSSEIPILVFFFWGGGGDLMWDIWWAFWDILVIFDQIEFPFPPPMQSLLLNITDSLVCGD